jgi:hypothetical protein
MAGLPNPASFIAAANAFPNQSTLSIAQMLTAFPQYNSLQDTFGGPFSENFAYQRGSVHAEPAHDPAASLSTPTSLSPRTSEMTAPSAAVMPFRRQPSTATGKAGKQDRIDRSWTTISVPQS